MKTPAEWMILWKARLDWKSFAELVDMIQQDALRAPDCWDVVILRDSIKALDQALDSKSAEVERYRQKWLEARKHLRAANEGAERNAIALSLATERNIRVNKTNQELHKQLHEKSIQENSQESRQEKTGEL